MIQIAPATFASIRALRDELQNLEKQKAFATRVAITRLSARVAAEERKAIATVFDRPTPFTLRSVLNVQRNTGTGYVRVVKIRDEAAKGTAPEKYLAAQVEGGERRAKRFERAFRFIDFQNNEFTDRQMFAVPGRGANLDAYGNVPGSRIVRILSAIKAAQPTAGYEANITDKSKKRYSKRERYFMGKAGPGRRTMAIWERHGPGLRNIKPVFVAVEQPRYKPRLDFFGIGERLVAREYQPEFERALDEALRTARP